MKKLCIQLLDETLREDRTANLEFHCRPRPRNHRKRRWTLFKKKDSRRRLLDRAHSVSAQNSRRDALDTRARVVQHNHAPNVPGTKRLGCDFPKSFDVLFKLRIKLSRSRDAGIDNCHSHLAQCSHHRNTVRIDLAEYKNVLWIDPHFGDGPKEIDCLPEQMLNSHYRRVFTKRKSGESGALQQCSSYFKRVRVLL